MPEQSIDQLLTALEADLSDTRGTIMCLEDIIAGHKIENRMLKAEIAELNRVLEQSTACVNELRDEIERLAPPRPDRRHAGIVSAAGMLKALKCHMGRHHGE